MERLLTPSKDKRISKANQELISNLERIKTIISECEKIVNKL